MSPNSKCVCIPRSMCKHFHFPCSSEMTVYVLERSVMGSTRHLLAADVFMFLQNATRKVSLTPSSPPPPPPLPSSPSSPSSSSPHCCCYCCVQAELEKLGVVGLYPKTGFNEEHLKLYLENPPAGNTAATASTHMHASWQCLFMAVQTCICTVHVCKHT